MQAIQTRIEKTVNLDPYLFSISEMTEGPNRRVVVSVRQANRGDFNGEDERILNSIFGDVEKWDAITAGGSTILTGLGFGGANAGTYSEYSPGKYRFQEDKGLHSSELKRYYVQMGIEERHRLERMNIQWPGSDEIASLLENVSKWRSFSQAIRLIRSIN
jgi:hypothetical protein